MLWGTACLKSYSKTQGTIAQSSAESELIAVVKAACEAIGSVSLADDLGLSLRVRLHIDAQAALGILERQGVGRVRHLDIGVLWLQEQQVRRVVELTKVLGTENPADLMTKYLGRDAIDQYSRVLGYEYREGRSATTAQLHRVQRSTISKGAHQAPDRVQLVGEQRNAQQWRCVGPGHWQSCHRSARAFRSAAVAGIKWPEVIRRVTREVPSGIILEDLHPLKDKIEEDVACRPFGGSRDIQTDIYIQDRKDCTPVDRWDATESTHNNTQAHPSQERSRVIAEYRGHALRKVNEALNDHPQDVAQSQPQSVTFSRHRVEYDI